MAHKSPFENLEVLRNDHEPGQTFIDKWVVPFYLNCLSLGETDTTAFAAAAGEIKIDIVKELLGDFNWRSRITGSIFAAINNYVELLDIIGKHLLKSEVCYAGKGYCLALASFGGEDAKRYLVSYLDYYIDRPDLWFDQADAFCALENLDKMAADQRLPKWDAFVSDKPSWNLDRSREVFQNSLQTLCRIKEKRNDL